MPPTFTQYPIPPIPEDFPLGSLSAAALSDWVAKNAYSTRTFDPWHAYFSRSSPPSPLQENDNIHSRVPIREQGPDIDKPSTKPGLAKPSTQLPSGLRDPADVSGQAGEEGVQRVLIEQDRTGWARISDMVQKYDEDRIRDVKEDMDTLLVFAGLFSAVLTTFLVETYSKLESDSGDTSSDILLQISHQLASLSLAGNFINSTTPAFAAQPFVAPVSFVRINTLWSCSLVLALITASLAILVKQWFHEYMSHESQSPLSHLRLRFFRHDGLVRWRVFELAAALPMLLQLALLLFFIGLSEFLRRLNLIVGWITTTAMLIWLILYVFTILAPVFSSQCPYRTPMLRDAIRSLRANRGYILWMTIDVVIFVLSLPLRIPLWVLPCLPIRQAFDKWAYPHRNTIRRWFTWIPPPEELAPQGEQEIRRSNFSDFAILCRSRSLFQDEQLWSTINQCTPDIDLLSALTCVRTYRPQSQFNKTTVSPPAGWMTLLPKDAEESFFDIFERMLHGLLDCPGVDISNKVSFERTYESWTSLIQFTSTEDAKLRSFFFGPKERPPHFPAMFMSYLQGGGVATATLFLSLYSASVNSLTTSGTLTPWRVICGSLIVHAGGQLPRSYYHVAIRCARAFIHRLRPEFFDILIQNQEEAKIDYYIWTLMNNHHLDLNPLALCYTIAMFSLAISPDAIGNSSGLLLFTTELYVAAKKELGIMKTDDTWKDCALQTVQAFRRLRKYDKRAVSSPIYNAIEGISMGISGGQAALRPRATGPVTGNAHGDMEEVIVAEATYVFLKEPSASQFRREFGLQQYDGVKFERFEDEDDDDGDDDGKNEGSETNDDGVFAHGNLGQRQRPAVAEHSMPQEYLDDSASESSMPALDPAV